MPFEGSRNSASTQLGKRALTSRAPRAHSAGAAKSDRLGALSSGYRCRQNSIEDAMSNTRCMHALYQYIIAGQPPFLNDFEAISKRFSAGKRAIGRWKAGDSALGTCVSSDRKMATRYWWSMATRYWWSMATRCWWRPASSLPRPPSAEGSIAAYAMGFSTPCGTCGVKRPERRSKQPLRASRLQRARVRSMSLASKTRCASRTLARRI